MKPDHAYRRLPGRRRTFGRRYSLWLGDDHLLAVDSTGYAEDYTRFYLADIRGVLCRRTRNGTFRSLGFALAACVFLVLALAGKAHGPGAFCGFLSGCFLFALLYNLLRGPTCVCHLLMPLGSQRLPALGRERQVAKFRDRIGPLICLVQGTVSPEELAAGMAAEPVAGFHPAAAVPRTATGDDGKAGESDYRGRAHWTLFTLLLLDAGFSTLQMSHQEGWVKVVASLLQLLLFSCTIVALVRQRGSRLPAAVRRTVWGALGVLCVSLFAVQAYASFYVFSMVRSDPNKGQDLQQLMRGINLYDLPVGVGIGGVYIVAAASLGIFGLLAMLRWQRGGATTGGSEGA